MSFRRLAGTILLIGIASLWLLGAAAEAAQESPDPFDAIANDRPEDLSAYLNAGGDPNVADSAGPLLLRAVRSYPDLALILIERHADPNVSSHGITPLFVAAEKGDTELVESLISHGALLNLKPEDIASPLWPAMDNGNIDLAKLLLRHGAIMPKGYESLLYAVRSGNIELLRIAIDANAPDAARFNTQPNGIPPQDMTEALQKAPLVVQATLPALQLLLENGFDPNIEEGVALGTASAAGNTPRMELLLAHGANPNLGQPINGGNDIPLLVSTTEGQTDAVSVLLRSHADVNASDLFGDTALLEATEHEREAIAGILLDAGANPNQAKKDGTTPLESAAKHNHLGIAKLLVQHGASVNANGNAALITVTKHGNLDFVRLLVEHGAISGSYTEAAKALEAAVEHADIAKFLLSRGARIPSGTGGLLWAIQTDDAKLVRSALAQTAPADVAAISFSTIITYDSGGRTEHSLLLGRTTLEIAEILLGAGFDANAGHGRPLTYASATGNLAMVELLLRHGANASLGSDDDGTPAFPLVEASSSETDDDEAELVRVLLSAHADPNATTPGGRSALMKAAMHGRNQTLRTLIAAKAELNRQDAEGNTALMLAAHQAQPDAMRALLEAGADVNLRSKDGRTALTEAAREGSSESLSLLIEHGARLTDRDKGRTAEQIAASRGNREAVKVLRKKAAPADLWLPQNLELDHSQTPGHIRRALLDSPILTDTFLIGVAPQEGQEFPLTDLQTERLTARLQEVLDFLKRIAGQRKRDLDRLLYEHRLSLASTTIQLTNSGAASAGTIQTDIIPAGGILIDVKLISAAFAASVQADDQIDTTDSNPSIPKLFQVLEDDRQEIEQYVALADLKVKRDEQGRYDGLVHESGKRVSRSISREADQLTRFAPKIFPAAIQYYGILLFVVAHELGHITLGHGLKQVGCLERERAADKFAAILLSDALVGLSISLEPITHLNAPSRELTVIARYLAIDRAQLSAYTGFFLFFGKSYELANFPASTEGCIYPEPEERVKASVEVMQSFASAGQDRLLTKLAMRKNLQSFLDAGLVARYRIIAESETASDDKNIEFVVSLAKFLRSQGYYVLGSREAKPGDLLVEKDQIPILIHTVIFPRDVGDAEIEESIASLEIPYAFSEVWLVANASFSGHTRDFARQRGIRLFDIRTLERSLPQQLRKPNPFG